MTATCCARHDPSASQYATQRWPLKPPPKIVQDRVLSHPQVIPSKRNTDEGSRFHALPDTRGQDVVNDRGFARTFGCVPKRDPLQAKSDVFQTKFVEAVQIWSREDGIYSNTCLSANDVISVSTVLFRAMSRKATYGISTSRALTTGLRTTSWA